LCCWPIDGAQSHRGAWHLLVAGAESQWVNDRIDRRIILDDIF